MTQVVHIVGAKEKAYVDALMEVVGERAIVVAHSSLQDTDPDQIKGEHHLLVCRYDGESLQDRSKIDVLGQKTPILSMWAETVEEFRRDVTSMMHQRLRTPEQHYFNDGKSVPWFKRFAC